MSPGQVGACRSRPEKPRDRADPDAEPGKGSAPGVASWASADPRQRTTEGRMKRPGRHWPGLRAIGSALRAAIAGAPGRPWRTRPCASCLSQVRLLADTSLRSSTILTLTGHRRERFAGGVTSRGRRGRPTRKVAVTRRGLSRALPPPAAVFPLGEAAPCIPGRGRPAKTGIGDRSYRWNRSYHAAAGSATPVRARMS